jgi:hypothetical protein
VLYLQADAVYTMSLFDCGNPSICPCSTWLQCLGHVAGPVLQVWAAQVCLPGTSVVLIDIHQLSQSVACPP